ncbi:hypothetical protein IFM89_003710 [Coptis chinensis]|uniref:Protein KOKOPELLI n=1 Tax=Coptis chinensis TaxID=261450 RepID=A0A835M8L0_9MAGN|nr:hypothetical protein IFM89_003710 [Coptis chinensis]
MEQKDMNSDLDALTNLYHILQINENEGSQNNIITEEGTSGMNQVTLKQGELSKELSKLHLPPPNRVFSTSPSGIRSSVNDLNSSSFTSYGNKRVRVQEESSMSKLNSFEEIISYLDKDFNHNEIGIEHIALALKEKAKGTENSKKSMHQGVRNIQQIRSIMRPSLNATSSKAVSVSSQSDHNHSDHDKRNRVDSIFGVSEEDLAKAIQNIEATRWFNANFISQVSVDPVKENKNDSDINRIVKQSVLTETKSDMNLTTDFALDGNELLPNRIHKGTQMPSPKHEKVKEITPPFSIPSQTSMSILMRRTGELPSRSSTQASKPYHKQSQVPSENSDSLYRPSGQLVSLNDKPVHLRCDSLKESVRKTNLKIPIQSTLATQTLSSIKTTDKRRYPGTPTPPLMSTTVEPTLKRMETHAKNQPLDSNQRSSRARNRTSPERGHSCQLTSLPTLPQQIPRVRTVERIKEDRPVSHLRRGGMQMDAHKRLHNRTLPPYQIANTRSPICTSASSSESSWSTDETSTSQSDDSVQTSLRTEQRVRPSSHLGPKQETKVGMSPERNRIPRRRRSQQSSGSSPHQVGPVAHGKEIGRFKRFKNKLGVIFHHHHHHHHHHHNDDNITKAQVHHAASSDHHHSFWTYVGKMLHHTSGEGHEKSSSKAHKKNRGRAKPHGGNQAGYLHGLMDGLVRNVLHSKKSKRSEKKMKRVGRINNHSDKKKIKKWNWWQKFHKKKVKRKAVSRQTTTRKQHARLRFKAKRPMLKALTLY